MNAEDIELVPEVKGEPFFKTEEKYEKFRKEYVEEVTLKLKALEGFHYRLWSVGLSR